VRAFVADEMKAKEEADKGVLYSSPQGDLQKPRSMFDFNLALRAAIEAEMTGRVPPPEEVAQKPLLWYASVSLQQQWLKHHRDQWKLNNGQGVGHTNGNRK
jgi:hypothetical protein